MRPIVGLVLHVQKAVHLGGAGLVLDGCGLLVSLLAGFVVSRDRLEGDQLLLGLIVLFQLAL